MLSTPGPTRMILIRSGRYDHAEITFGNSVHLVGHNNVGKTSAIATLQFLYVAAFNEMRFSRSWDETVRYYFFSDTSYVLFETLTADQRFVVFGLRGRGHLGAFGVDRFAYTGAYRKEDFITEDNRVRSFDDVKRRIVTDRFFKLLEPSDIRAAIVGESKTPEINAGIVPLKDASRYHDFVLLFKNLLRLNHLSQQDIKDTLLAVYRRDIRHAPEVDLSREYGDVYQAVHSEGVKIHQLDQVAPSIVRLRTLRDRRNKAREDLPALYNHTVARKAKRIAELQTRFSDFSDQVADIGKKIERANGDLQKLQEKTTQSSEKAGVLKQWFIDFEELEKSAINYLPDLEEQTRINLQEQSDQLTAKIVSTGDPEALRIKREGAKLLWERKVKQRNNYHRLLATKLQQLVGTDSLTRLSRIFNPFLLRLPVEDGSIEISDEALLSNALNSINAQIQNDVFSASGITIPLSMIEAAALSDIETLDREIAEAELALQTAEADYQTALNMAGLIQQRDGLKTELAAAVKRLEQYNDWNQKKTLVTDKKGQLKHFGTEIEEFAKNQEKLLADNADDVKMQLLAKNQLIDIHREQEQLDKARLVQPDLSWPVGVHDPDWPTDVLPLVKLYNDTYRDYETLEGDLRDRLREVEVQLPDGFNGIDATEKIDSAVELIESLKSRKEAYETHLGNVIKGMQATFQRLLEALNSLRECAEGFNRQIGRVSISNLRRLSIEIIEHTEITKNYRAIVDMQKADLFADISETEAAIDRIYEVIRRLPVIKLSNWFGVRFVVETAEGNRKDYDDLSVIESNGTTMAIKTLVNMVLIRALMKDRRPYRIPFYIDEATQVDTPNLKEVVSVANEMGFCPVLASTAPVSVAEYLNFIQITSSQRAIIDPKRCIHRKPLANAETA